MKKETNHGSHVIIFDDIPFDLDEKKLLQELRMEASHPLFPELLSVANQVAKIIKPKAIYRVCYIEDRDEGSVTFGGQKFESKILSQNVKEVERVFAYIATCGIEVDQIFENDGDMLKQFWIDSIKEMALEQALDFLFAEIKGKYGLNQLPSMSPGSGTREVWPIEQQKLLFSLFGDAEKSIDVALTESFLMVPNKTISGICFAQGIEYITCQLCPRENCPGRRAPYNPHLREQFPTEASSLEESKPK